MRQIPGCGPPSWWWGNRQSSSEKLPRRRAKPRSPLSGRLGSLIIPAKNGPSICAALATWNTATMSIGVVSTSVSSADVELLARCPRCTALRSYARVPVAERKCATCISEAPTPGDPWHWLWSAENRASFAGRYRCFAARISPFLRKKRNWAPGEMPFDRVALQEHGSNPRPVTAGAGRGRRGSEFD